MVTLYAVKRNYGDADSLCCKTESNHYGPSNRGIMMAKKPPKQNTRIRLVRLYLGGTYITVDAHRLLMDRVGIGYEHGFRNSANIKIQSYICLEQITKVEQVTMTGTTIEITVDQLYQMITSRPNFMMVVPDDGWQILADVKGDGQLFQGTDNE
jgi:hypothetical protein